MNYFLHILIVFEIYLILALAVNLLAGYSGLLSLTQAGFYGIGAYVAALLLVNFQTSFLFVLVAAIGINIFLCLPVVWFCIRLRDLYFALTTLAWQIILFTILYNWVSITNGPFGITGIPKPELFGFRFSSLLNYSLLGGIVSLFVLIFFIILHRTHLSRLFQGGRDNQLALISFGKSPCFYKALAIFISSGISGIAGVLFASYYSYVDPSSFTLDESIFILSIVLIGGLGSVKGSVIGALFYVLLPEVLRFVNISDLMTANIRMMLYSLILLLVLMYRPYGLFGKFRYE